MFRVKTVSDDKGRVLIKDPPIAKLLFQSTQASWLWLVIRVWIGWEWFSHGLEKLQNPAWMDGSGTAILGFWSRAAAVPAPPAKPLVAYDWYRSFLQLLIDSGSAGWFSYVIVGGEIAIGIGLILGAFVGIAATGALLMNMSFLLAGTASTNPVLAAVAVLLILAWKNAGYIGVDRFLLPALGTPWGRIGERETEAERRPRRPVGRGSALAHH